MLRLLFISVLLTSLSTQAGSHCIGDQTVFRRFMMQETARQLSVDLKMHVQTFHVPGDKGSPYYGVQGALLTAPEMMSYALAAKARLEAGEAVETVAESMAFRAQVHRAGTSSILPLANGDVKVSITGEESNTMNVTYSNLNGGSFMAPQPVIFQSPKEWEQSKNATIHKACGEGVLLPEAGAKAANVGT